MVLLIPGSGYKINFVKVSGTSQSINFSGEKEQLAEVWDLDRGNRTPQLQASRPTVLLREAFKWPRREGEQEILVLVQLVGIFCFRIQSLLPVAERPTNRWYCTRDFFRSRSFAPNFRNACGGLAWSKKFISSYI